MFVEAFLTPVVCSPLTNQRIEFVKENCPHLTGLELADNTDGQSELKIDILIGMDYCFSFSLEGRHKELVGLLQWRVSLVGFWEEVIRLPLGDNATTNSYVTAVKCCTTSTVLNEDLVRKSLQKVWDVEAIGIPSDEEKDIVMKTFKILFILMDLVMLLSCHLKRDVKVCL